VQYNLLHSIFGFPNIIVIFATGNIIDYFGLRKANLIFVIIILIGHSIFAISAMYSNYNLALLGRLLLG
jgi:MFS family permease